MPDLSDPAILFWEHARGDTLTLPCPHVVFDHPGGDRVMVPCTHGVAQAHPAGDPLTTLCMHLVQLHPGGHPMTVPCTHGLTQAHPGGDRIGFVTIPCIHVSTVHPAGDTVTMPCPHLTQQHPGGGVTYLPCTHLSLVHPEGDPLTVPCVHARQQHPEGHPGPPLPCTHPLPVVRSEFGGGLRFYTDEPKVQEWMIQIVQGLLDDRCVAAALWDHYDPTGKDSDGPDRVMLPFGELFRVYSPTLETLVDGPVIGSIYAFAERVKKNNPRNRSLGARIDEVVERNVGPKP